MLGGLFSLPASSILLGGKEDGHRGITKQRTEAMNRTELHLSQQGRLEFRFLSETLHCRGNPYLSRM